ncbi:MAG: hypothetical protein HYZ42_08855 [Bacteroidetes bacterium]|nr:hypothetical protein [Bacteroidota bacterium]
MIKVKQMLSNVRYSTIALFFILHISSNGQKAPSSSSIYGKNILVGTEAKMIDKNIRSIFQDKKGIYWFGTNSNGVYRYDGKALIQFTEKDGLSNNQVQSIQEDILGNIWFGTGVFGVSKFDGKGFTSYSNTENLQINHSSDITSRKESNDLWFAAGGGVFHYIDSAFVYLPLFRSTIFSSQLKSLPYELSPYAVYSILKDQKGNLWFGTQAQGVCRYDGKSFTWFTDKGLAGPAVLGLFEDSKGNIWFGNNGSGLFRYDGKTLINFTEEKGLSNKEFKEFGESGSGNLARVYAINEDNEGNLWVGTVDSGVWRFDGVNLINYTIKDGLTSNAINVIYKDKKGELWFGTDADGICKFNGKTFAEFVVK